MKKRQLVMELRLVFDGENDKELFESLRDSLSEQYDALTQYAGVEKFRIYERRKNKES